MIHKSVVNRRLSGTVILSLVVWGMMIMPMPTLSQEKVTVTSEEDPFVPKLTDGSGTNARPEVGRINGCTATLISQTWFITAAHCVNFGNPIGGNTFRIDGSMSYDIDRIFSLGDDLGDFDIAIGNLRRPVPATVATPARLAERRARDNELMTVIGYGCSARPVNGTFRKRFTTFRWGTSDRLCPGDSGGPVRRGRLRDGGEIVAINSGYFFGDRNDNGRHDAGEPTFGDIFANVSLLKHRIESLMRAEDFGFEVGRDRFGLDLRSLRITNGGGQGPERCWDACRREKKCKAFSYELSRQRCWLKEAVPDTRPNANVISGLPTLPGAFNLPGSDFAHYTTAHEERCEADCARNSRCQAFTYLNGHCWLKDKIPNVRGCRDCRTGSRGGFEKGIDRLGGDYEAFWTTSHDPATCSQACAIDSRCLAWTYVPRGIQGSDARCWLKDELRDPRRDSRVGGGMPITSGIKQGLETNIDRLGQDYRSFWIDEPRPEICQAACASENPCLAWTYVPPGVQGDRAKCWLKNGIPAARRRVGMVSGRKGMEFFK